MSRKSQPKHAPPRAAQRAPLRTPPPTPDPPIPQRPIATAPRWPWWLAGVLASLAAAATYLPTLNNGFVTWDDPDYITRNEYVAAPDGLARIWDPRVRQQQYYPLVFTSFWLEHRVWGFEPRGYHLTNLVLHAANAALLVTLLRLLGLSPWAAWLAATLFAVHPLNVASVAWAAERKNVLSGLFALMAAAIYVCHIRRPHWWLYLLCLSSFVLGLLSKTAVVTLPATLVLSECLVRRRWTWMSLARVAPLVLLGMVAAWHTHSVELSNSMPVVEPLDPLLRPLAAAGAIWFYLGKLLVPVGLAGVYPRWDVAAHWPIFAGGLAALVVVIWGLWRWRRQVGGLTLWGGGHFLATLVPVLGLVPFNYTQYSLVADHFTYMAGIGVFVAVAGGADSLRRRLSSLVLRSFAPTAATAGLLILLATSSWQRCVTAWRDGRSFWQQTIAASPDGWVAHFNLGNLLDREGNWIAAAEQYQRCTEVFPKFSQAHASLGLMLSRLGKREQAVEAYEQAALTAIPDRKSWTQCRYDLADLLVQLGRPEDARTWLEEVVQRKPFLVDAHLRLAQVLQRLGRREEAIESYERALKLAPNSEAARSGLRAAQQGQPGQPSATSRPATTAPGGG